MDNSGSISELYVIPCSDILSIQWNYTNENYDVSLVYGKSFTKINIILDTGYWSERSIQSENGIAFQTQISAIIAKHDKAYENQWKLLRNEKLAVLTIDNNESIRLSGDNASGFFIVESPHSGDKFESRNQIVLMFQDTFPHASYFISDPL